MDIDDNWIRGIANLMAAGVLLGLLIVALKRVYVPKFCPACKTGSVLYPHCGKRTCPGHLLGTPRNPIATETGEMPR